MNTEQLEKVNAENRAKVQESLENYKKRYTVPDRPIVGGKYFSANGTFVAITEAEKFVRAAGYSIGSMQRDYPIAIAHGDCLISKWCNLGKDVDRIDGYIIPDPEFREGGATVIFFK